MQIKFEDDRPILSLIHIYTTPGQIIAVYNNKDKKKFTIGIVDDVTNLSLPIGEDPDTTPAATISCKFWRCV